MTIERTCSGGCCAVFWHDRTHERLADDREHTGEMEPGEYLTVTRMLMPLTVDEAEERSARFGVQPPGHFRAFTDAHDRLYTCMHWDEETRLCRIYDERPTMCADYPYDRECTLCSGCTYRPPEDVQAKWREIHAQRGDAAA